MPPRSNGPGGLGAAAEAEEAEQSQNDDHNQDDHENAEDAPPSSLGRHHPRPGAGQTGIVPMG
jgi:hypothetical protein